MYELLDGFVKVSYLIDKTPEFDSAYTHRKENPPQVGIGLGATAAGIGIFGHGRDLRNGVAQYNIMKKTYDSFAKDVAIRDSIAQKLGDSAAKYTPEEGKIVKDMMSTVYKRKRTGGKPISAKIMNGALISLNKRIRDNMYNIASEARGKMMVPLTAYKYKTIKDMEVAAKRYRNAGLGVGALGVALGGYGAYKLYGKNYGNG